MREFKVGQRWISEAEPELGLGTITQVESKMITCYFPASQVDRTYGVKTAPLRRIQFSSGDEIKLNDGKELIVSKVKEIDGVLFYETDSQLVHESHLSDVLSFSKPEERLFAGSSDPLAIFKMRYNVLLQQRKLFLSPVRGFVGPRLNIIPHQFYVAQEVTQRSRVRVLLADEVGLGKTIEAGLILHQLILTGRIQRCLILVPDSLVYQWFVEMLKKFQLNFITLHQDSDLKKQNDIFDNGQLFIASLKYVLREEWLMKQVVESEWDMLVVDEAHQIKWSPQSSSTEYDFISIICRKAQNVLLLSGTPEILGLAGHYARLHLLDPDRFFSYEKFLSETSDYHFISGLVKKILFKKDLSKEDHHFLQQELGMTNYSSDEVIHRLIDLHGTGRIYYRNTRKQMASFSEFFPERILFPHKLQVENKNKIWDLKCQWLIHFVQSHKDDKTLLICHEKEVVLMLEKILKSKTTASVAIFHSGMSLLSRDRQAAYFRDEEGAQMLLSTEIGSEGRNFEFAHHLILFDLPILPDLLEQRIGRLDRIGQKQNINIHVPYVANSRDEIYLRWYHEGFNAFESSPRGATELFMTVRNDLEKVLEEKNTGVKLEDLILKTKSVHVEIENKLEDGQDKLIELNSYHHTKAMNFVNDLQLHDRSSDLKDLMLDIWSQLGVDIEDMNDPDTFFIKPGDNMSIPHFPGLEREGITVTFKRENALHHEKFVFLTWDHPMVLGIMDFISSKELGNVTLASWKTANKESFLMEGFFLLSAISQKKLMAEKWFPPTPLRVLLNAKMQDLTSKISKKEIDQNTVNVSLEKKQELASLPKDFMKSLLKKARDYCLPRAKQYKEKFIQEMLASMDSEINRLETLRLKNPTVSQGEIEILRKNKDGLREAMEKADISLDSIRIIVNE